MTFAGHTEGAVAPVLSTSPVSSATAGAELGARPSRFFQTRPVLRRVAYVVGYEGLSVLATAIVMSELLGHGGGDSALTAILLSTTATIWNYVWNTAFESIERRVGATGRTARSRALHAIGYEGGVLVFTIPLVAMLLGVGLFEAAMIEGGLLLFFLVFTLVYAWAFDRIFGLPASAVSTAAPTA
ncbi:PACE efflux transporter [Leucobacter soli]|uniref:Chlorhexidine efflux transporter domain-containing protein n=1 Tax=Leucobacter soli TaxID=2812850 RepID=A0A916NGV8_9MICO|nr:PACE efflux transporter [Leucobacter soli]CAG7605289.1 hypothetical protein LEUCIP111803_00815 [Leucobacter soli]